MKKMKRKVKLRPSQRTKNGVDTFPEGINAETIVDRFFLFFFCALI